MREHFVMAYVNHASRRFTLTARKRTARLRGVTLQTKHLGYRALVIAHRLDKATAETMKRAVRSAYELAGYVYQTRSPLP
jgi:hypothetical protein